MKFEPVSDSGRYAMLSVDEARLIAAHWRPQFVDESSFETSWSRCFEMVGDPDVHKVNAWLAKDQAKDAIRAAGIVREPLLPTQQSPAFTAAVEAAVEALALTRNDCWHCGKFEDESAAEICGNPRWHLPNANLPRQTPVPGWKQVA